MLQTPQELAEAGFYYTGNTFHILLLHKPYFHHMIKHDLTWYYTHVLTVLFVYLGVHDQVRCFMCDGGLRSWSPEDVPWTEHCRWFPACPYAKEKKGEDFIALVQASVEYINGVIRSLRIFI